MVKSLYSAHPSVKINVYVTQDEDFILTRLTSSAQPGFMAETFLVPHHPAARDLQTLQYTQDRDRYREEHRVLFRFVYADLCFIETMFSNSKIYPRDVAFLNRLWKQIDDLLE